LGSSLLAQHLDIGLADHLRSSWTALFVLTVAAQTLVAYWTHRAMHAAPLFWRVHRVHHADTFVDVSTSLRHHPVELLVTAPATATVILLTGAPVSVVLASETFLVAATLWGHADIRLPHRLDRALGLVLVTPRLHRVHHSPERRFHDSNYGDTFTLWDRLFGTFSDEPQRMRVGLDGQGDRADNLLDQVLSPLHAA
jgi:sterol desaturase/sphingolipid hydroxylase (fatty acid hydroxylase superfamily)